MGGQKPGAINDIWWDKSREPGAIDDIWRDKNQAQSMTYGGTKAANQAQSMTYGGTKAMEFVAHVMVLEDMSYRIVGGGTDSVSCDPEHAGAVDDKTGEAKTCRHVVQEVDASWPHTYLVFVDESDEHVIETDSLSMTGVKEDIVGAKSARGEEEEPAVREEMIEVEEGMIGVEDGMTGAEDGMIELEEGMIGVQGGKSVVREARSGLGVAGPRLHH
jgi:hypothetical protein